METPKRKIPGMQVDENGIGVKYTPKKPEVVDISIDFMMREVLTNISGILRAIKVDVGTGMPSRESVQNLKDCQAMLKDLRKDEQDFLESLTDEQLAEYKVK